MIIESMIQARLSYQLWTGSRILVTIRSRHRKVWWFDRPAAGMLGYSATGLE
jgi:hypothetical protein